MLTVEASIFHFLCIILSETCCGKNAEATKISQISQLMTVFQRFVTKSRIACAAHQAITIIRLSLLCECVQFQHSSLHYSGSIVYLQNFVKINGVP
jgi:hypothetical protein